MDTTTKTLPISLHQALTTNGLTPRRATRVMRLLPPAGQHHLLTTLEADPQNTFPRLAGAFVGDLADRFRTTWADATTIRNTFVTAVQR